MFHTYLRVQSKNYIQAKIHANTMYITHLHICIYMYLDMYILQHIKHINI